MTLVVQNDPDATILIAVDTDFTQPGGAGGGGALAADGGEVLDKLEEVGQQVARVCQSVYARAKQELGEVEALERRTP